MPVLSRFQYDGMPGDEAACDNNGVATVAELTLAHDQKQLMLAYNNLKSPEYVPKLCSLLTTAAVSTHAHRTA